MPDAPSFGAVVSADDVAATARFYAEHFGFQQVMDLGWFVSLRHGDRPYELSVIARDHQSLPPEHRTADPGGVMLAFVVEDADAAERRVAEGAGRVVRGCVDEPWGQRHFYARDPSGTMIDVVQITQPDPEWLREHGLG